MANDECIVCKNKINHGAKKCLHCGSRQGWSRFFDVGNTSLSLLIAVFSVFALASDNFLKVMNVFSDHKAAHITGKIMNVGPNSLSIFLDNDGPGLAILSGGGICSIWAAGKSSDLDVPPASGPQDLIESIRYPKPSEIVGRYIYSYGSEEPKPTIIAAGAHKIMTFPLVEILIRPKDDLPEAKSEYIKSYCSVGYSHENGSENVVFNIVDPLDVSYFSLDQPAVQKALRDNEKRRKQRRAARQ